jgi:acetyl-CoA carboxylase biotin carboxylase subunit
MLGDKIEARKTAIKANAPVIPGSDDEIETYADAKALAESMKYPVIIKAAAGGGGRGIRIVHKASELESKFNSCKKEAETAFGNGALYMEKYIVDPRHIEVQILGDSFGNVVHLFERDCSLQRNNQKLIEEAPSAFLDNKTRSKLTKAAVSLAKTAGYENAGTIEFLVDKNKDVYFMEMNTRIQVEHPVTECITGIDLIKEQIKVASGKKLE